MSKESILIIDDDEKIRRELCWAFESEYQIFQASDMDGAIKIVSTEDIDLTLLDLHLPPVSETPETGFNILRGIQKNQPDIPVIIMTGYGERDYALKAVDSGAYDFFEKPMDLKELKVIIERGLAIRALKRENEALRQQLIESHRLEEGIIGNSERMNGIMDMVKSVAPADSTVLITGETGTGKELIARIIHKLSHRKDRPFIAMNCAAIPESLAEDELFGHEKGAFTGAINLRKGKFETAHEGTLFLDEIGDLSLNLQAKLLRVLQEKFIERIGGERSIKTDFRLIAATNSDIPSMVSEGRFREDLFYRIKVITIHLPPLRERLSDIPLLALHFLKEYSRIFNKDVKDIDPSAMDILCRYAWHGNIRELKSAIERGVVLSKSKILTEDLLPIEMVGRTSLPASLSLEDSVKEYKRSLVIKALKEAKGNKEKAAGLLNISRSYIFKLIDELKIDIPANSV